MKLEFRTVAIVVGSLLLLATFALALASFLRGADPEGSPIEPAAERVFTPVLPAEDMRIDDFEVRAVSKEAWHAMAVDGRTRADFLIVPGGAVGGSRYHLSADLIRPSDPEPSDVAAVIARLADGHGRNVSRYRGIELWLDATPGLYIVQLGSARVIDHDHFNAYIEIVEPGWQHFRIPFENFGQEGFGEEVEWSGRDVTHLAFFSVNPGSVLLSVDEVRFFE